MKDAAGLDTSREKQIGQHIGYRYDVNLLPDYERLTPFLKGYMEFMGWDDLNWLEDVHMGYEAGEPAIFDRNINGWVRIPKNMKLPDNQQDRDMLARELLVRFQTSPKHPLRRAEQGLSKVLSDGDIRIKETSGPAALAASWSFRRGLPRVCDYVADRG